MANPVFVECPANTWVKVATAVTSGNIHAIQTVFSGPRYLQTYRVPGSKEVWELGATTDDDVYLRMATAADLVDTDIAADRATAVADGKDYFLEDYTTIHDTVLFSEQVTPSTSQRVYMLEHEPVSSSVAIDVWVLALDFAGRVRADLP
jgi:hypothetical protein